MANEDKGPWLVVGVQIHAAMDSRGHRAEAFLAEHARQATDACLGFLRTIPAGVEPDLVPLVEHLGVQSLAHTRFLCDQAELSDAQSERLLAASRRGYGRFLEVFRAECRAGRGRPGAGLVPEIEAALAAGVGCDASPGPTSASPAAESRPATYVLAQGRGDALVPSSPTIAVSESTDPMNSRELVGRPPANTRIDTDSRAPDRYEDEGGPGPD